MRGLIAALLVVAAWPLAAATLHSEIALDPVTREVPVAGAGPLVASNGRDTLAMWADLRGWPTVPLRAMRLRGEVPIDPHGFVVADGAAYGMALASDGEAYLAVYSDSPPTLQTARIAEGRVTHRTSPGEGRIRDLASNGTTYCALLEDSALFLDRNGERLAEVQLPESAQRVIAIDGRYWVVTMELEIELIPLTPDGLGAPLTIYSGIPQYVSVIAGQQHLLLAWLERNRPMYAVVNAEGQLVREPAKHTQSVGDLRPPDLAWDGREFLLSWTKDNDGFDGAKMVGIRIDTSGLAQTQAPFVVAGYGNGFVSAFNGREAVLIADERRNGFDRVITARAAGAFATYTLRDGTLLTRGGTGQSAQAIAATNDAVLAVWLEEQRLRGALHHPDGSLTQLELSGPERDRYGSAAAAAGDLFLVVWTAGLPARLFGRRVRANGELLDREPLVIANEFAGVPQVATDGTDFFVIWTGGGKIRGATVSAEGRIGAAVDFAQITSLGEKTVAWTGNAYVIAWSEGIPFEYRVAAVSRTGEPIGGWTLLTHRTADASEALSVAGDGPGTLLFWIEGTCVRGMPFPNGAPRTIVCDSGINRWFTGLSATWSDGAYTLLWHVRFADGARAVRVSANGTLIGNAFDVAPQGTEPLLAGAATLRGRLFVFYDRVVAEEPYNGVRRVFLRPITLDPGPRKSRAVRHGGLP